MNLFKPKQLIIYSILFGIAGGLTSCSHMPPKDVNNLCSLFKEKRSWYHDAKRAYNKWGIPIHVQAAIIHQESRFRAHAKPPRKKYFGVIPGPRSSTAYGYAQALDTTWAWYQQKNNKYRADRGDFSDVTDFIGWYTHITNKKAGVSKWDVYNQYLAYHEGHGGFERKSYEQKPWLKKVAKKVKQRAKLFHKQLNTCRKEIG